MTSNLQWNLGEACGECINSAQRSVCDTQIVHMAIGEPECITEAILESYLCHCVCPIKDPALNPGLWGISPTLYALT